MPNLWIARKTQPEQTLAISPISEQSTWTEGFIWSTKMKWGSSTVQFGHWKAEHDNITVTTHTT